CGNDDGGTESDDSDQRRCRRSGPDAHRPPRRAAAAGARHGAVMRMVMPGPGVTGSDPACSLGAGSIPLTAFAETMHFDVAAHADFALMDRAFLDGQHRCADAA